MVKKTGMAIGILVFVATFIPCWVGAQPFRKSTVISVDQLLKQEQLTIEKASVELLKLATNAADNGYNAIAFEATSIIAKFYPADPDLAELLKTYNETENKEITSDLQKEKDKVYSKAAKYILKYGDLLAQHNGPVLAQWVYTIAEEMGYPPKAKALKAVKKSLEGFKEEVKTVRREPYGTIMASGSEYTCFYRLPQHWSIDREWPVLFVFHGTGGGWGATGDTAERAIDWYADFAKQGEWIVVAIKDPIMSTGGAPDHKKVNQTIDEILATMVIRYRANPYAVGLSAPAGTGALCCWHYLECHPERLCAVEVSQGKFHGLSIRKGSPATKVPVKMGICKARNPNKVVGGHAMHEFDAVHIGQMQAAKKKLEQLGFTRFEWVEGDSFRAGMDIDWFTKYAREKVRRAKSVKSGRK